jgi:hypothetical protein
MRFLTSGVALLPLLLVMPASPAAGPAKADRTIRKEPAYRSRPQYFLLAFGPEAKKRVWVVLDGEDFYVDRNGNGDLTEAGERGKLPGEVEIEGDGKTKVTLGVNPPNSEGTLVCMAYVQGRYTQWAAVKPAGRPADAPVYHFQGPLRIDLVSPGKLVRGRPNDYVTVQVGTPPGGVHRNAGWVVIDQNESIPPWVNPSLEIEFPGKGAGAPPLKERVALRRTGQAPYLATVRVPGGAGPGKAKARLSFPDWKGFDVAPTLRELPLVSPGPEEEKTARLLQRQPRPLDVGKPAADLAKIDRSVPPEPAYRSKPRYCLLLLGREAKTRAWLVLDGDTLYVDRDGRGGWAKADKKVRGRTVTFRAREIQERDGTKHTDLMVTAEGSRVHPGRYRFNFISLNVQGRYREYTFIGGLADCNRWAESPREAPVRHFNGPLRMELSSQSPLVRGDQPAQLEAQITTKYPGGEWVFIDNRHGVPPDVHPVAEIEFPNRKPGAPPVKLRVALTQRC